MIRTSEQQIRYLSQAIQLEEAVNPAILRTTLLSISVTILVFTGWAALTNINEVARTPGEVVPSGYQQVVQHPDGGTVARILVAEGDSVTAGQPLIELDEAGIAEDLRRARARKTSLEMQEERLRAFIGNRAPDFARFKGSDAGLLRDQQSFFSSMNQSSAEERQIVSEQIEQKRRVIATLETELSTALANATITRQLFERKAELRQKGYLSETKYLEAQQAVNRIDGDISAIRSRIAVARAEIDEYRKRLTALGLTQNDRVNERLDAVIAELAQHGEILGKLEQRHARLSVRAPVAGIVKGLSVNTIGAVVASGETLMEIVPVENEMVVQVKIAPQHIGHVRPQQPVKVKLSSYDFSRYGLVDGRLEQISATTFQGENGERYYQGRIRLDHAYVGADKANVIVPGMTVMAEIITGEKTILQYLLKPIHNSLKTAFSEK